MGTQQALIKFSAANPCVLMLSVPLKLQSFSLLLVYLVLFYQQASHVVFTVFLQVVGSIGFIVLIICIMLPAGLPQSCGWDSCVGVHLYPAQSFQFRADIMLGVNRSLADSKNTPKDSSVRFVSNTVLILGGGVAGQLRAWPLESGGFEPARICMDWNLLLPSTGRVSLASYLTSMSCSVFYL